MTRTLLSSVKNCDTQSAKAILINDQYDNINAQDSCDSGTALFWACSNGLLDIVHILIALNADIEASTAWNATPLHASADNNHIDVARYLIKHRANVNSKTVYGDTPCHLAAYRGHREMVKLLVDCGNADLSVTNCKNRTSLDESICSSHDEISRYIHNAMILKNYHPKRLAELRMAEIPLDLTTLPSSELNSFEQDERYSYSDEDNNVEEGNRFIVKAANNGLANTTHYAVPFHCDTQITNRLPSDMIPSFPSAGPINNSNIYYSPNNNHYKLPNTSYSLQQRPVLQTNRRDTDPFSDSNMTSMAMNDLSSTTTAANHSQLSFLNICSRYISDNM